MPLDLRRGAVEEREVASGQQFKLIKENTDKMAVQSEEREGDDVEVVETSGCGGSVTVIFNPLHSDRTEVTKISSRSVLQGFVPSVMAIVEAYLQIFQPACHLAQNLGVPLEVRATLLGHRLRGSGTDQPGGDVMTSRYPHGGYGWNQQLRHAVTLLHTALLSYGLSY
jgi:hypothetical protein